MDYLKLLMEHYDSEINDEPEQSRLSFLAINFFDFATYDDAVDTLFARKAVEVCDAVTNGTTFDYIRDKHNYLWFLVMCNTAFFSGKLGWGTSIRGAWWDHGAEFKLHGVGLWDGNDQINQFTREEWEDLMRALSAFAAPEMSNAAITDDGPVI